MYPKTCTMKKNSPIFLFLFLFYGCVGEDFINDYVDPSLRITNPILEIREGGSYQFMVQFYDESGTKVTQSNLSWSVNPPNALTVRQDGTITAVTAGQTTLSVRTTGLQGNPVQTTTTFNITVAPVDVSTPTTATTSATTTSTTTNTGTDTNGVVVATPFYEGQIRSTSSYLLEGNYRYEHNGEYILVTLDSGYQADTALPGLYVYLGNNPSTTAGAYEIGPVTIFQGAHEYSLPSTIELMDYQYILYWCKPFNVKVGETKLFD